MLRKVILSAVFLLLISSLFVVASSAGRTGRTNLSDTPGCTCHGSTPSSGVTVLIDGPDSVEINSTTAYQVRISGGPAAAAGTNIAVSDGILAAISSTLQLSSGELTHTGPVSFGAGSEVVFDFEFTAPGQIGDVTLAATGNSVNLSGNTSGDEWNHAPDKTISVVNTSAIVDQLDRSPEGFVLHQNYPNPFNPKTVISYQLTALSNVELSVFNALGQKIRTLVDEQQGAGSYAVDFQAANLPSGTYFYTLKYGSNAVTKRMTLKK